MAKSSAVVPVTDCRVYPVKSKQGSKLKAFASITLGGAFAVTGLRVYDGAKGVFVAMPSRNAGSETAPEWADIAFPVTKEQREAILEKVLETFTATDGKPSKKAPASKAKKKK